ncbi:hypothetical protein OGAPHI_000708 [Ogataea philodendri]|uniref:Homeobox domain-containing protein n=1 Tax=Ogataea philodendri TaxID=1378263 RepID=A0A9P8PFB7_9ASCO|nr:uncharacterized protein OGAPHI_000708 [Ogataea philodendri]KAH3670997.1 hypothetical protein OGAPHI_000708 [Ogataea philodendri]
MWCSLSRWGHNSRTPRHASWDFLFLVLIDFARLEGRFGFDLHAFADAYCYAKSASIFQTYINAMGPQQHFLQNYKMEVSSLINKQYGAPPRLTPPSSPYSAMSDQLPPPRVQLPSIKRILDSSILDSMNRFPPPSHEHPAIPILPSPVHQYPYSPLSSRSSSYSAGIEYQLPAPLVTQRSHPQLSFPKLSPIEQSSPQLVSKSDSEEMSPSSPNSDSEYYAKNFKKKRSNLPKKTTVILLNWLNDNLEHPYPNSKEKQELVTKTGLSNQQLSNWFINARRRKIQLLREMKSNSTTV